ARKFDVLDVDALIPSLVVLDVLGDEIIRPRPLEFLPRLRREFSSLTGLGIGEGARRFRLRLLPLSVVELSITEAKGVKITNHNLRQISSSLDHLGLSDLKDKAKQLMFPWMSELASDGQLSYDRTFRDYRQMRYIAHSGGGAELMNLAAKIERGEEVDFKTEM
ncbi:uncharacterized protein LOC144356302, partial [Saccoglossus kowalevskii]